MGGYIGVCYAFLYFLWCHLFLVCGLISITHTYPIYRHKEKDKIIFYMHLSMGFM